MTIVLKLFASLTAHLPAEARARHTAILDVNPGATVLDVIQRQGLPEALCAIVLIDGAWVARPDRATRVLSEGQVLSIWPPVAGGSATWHRSLEMSLSREEFFRLLPAAVGPFEVTGETIRGIEGNRQWTIRLVPLPDRQMGCVRVPRYRVEVVVDCASEAEGEAFMGRFDRGFLRGGG